VALRVAAITTLDDHDSGWNGGFGSPEDCGHLQLRSWSVANAAGSVWQLSWATLLQRIGSPSGYGACDYYANGNRHLVPRPCRVWHANSAASPYGATALSSDGSSSYSEHAHSDWTCSYHGGAIQYVR
jgi:hypothetical protein